MASYNYITDTGLIVTDASDIRRVVESEMRAVFGQDLITDSNTPQGRLIDAEVLARRACIEALAQMANQINPNYSKGPFLDSLASFLDLERRGPTSSLLSNVKLTGVPLTPIPAGSVARSQTGVAWRSTRNVVLDADGVAYVDFESVDTGPITCDIGELSRVASKILGWETVRNPSQAVPGKLDQSDSALRRLRALTLALQGTSTPESIVSNLYASPVNATSVTYRENIYDKQRVIDGITMPPHSFWACVQGGQDEAIAKALLAVKTIGARWVGDVEITVTDDESGQPYDVQFQRPTEVPVSIRMTVLQGSFTGDIQNEVIDTALDYASGNVPGFGGFEVRDTFVSPATIAGAIQSRLVGMAVYSIEVKRKSDSDYSASPIPLALQEVATLQRGDISVTVKT